MKLPVKMRFLFVPPLLLLLLLNSSIRSDAVKLHEEAMADAVLRVDESYGEEDVANLDDVRDEAADLRPAGFFRRFRRGLSRLGRNIRRILPRRMPATERRNNHRITSRQVFP